LPAVVALVVAVAENGVIGRGGKLPWRLSSDLKTFRRLTIGKPLIMGRKTYQSIGRPLDRRDNIVVTRNPGWSEPGVHSAASYDAALALAHAMAGQRGSEEIMVIGGAEIYALAMPDASRIYLTRVHATIEGDATFSPLDPTQWREVARAPLPRGPKDDYASTLVVLERL
jgi:dihydrofolate reductase